MLNEIKTRQETAEDGEAGFMALCPYFLCLTLKNVKVKS